MKNSEIIKVGSLNIPKGRIDITDPCYEQDSYRNGIRDYPIESGNYNCYAIIKNCGKWGKRVSELMLLKDEYKKVPVFDEYIGYTGVDSGLAGFFITPKKDYSDDEWVKFCDELGPDNPTIKLTGEQFFSSSGFGDGEYEVRGSSGGNLVKNAIEIIFISKED